MNLTAKTAVIADTDIKQSMEMDLVSFSDIKIRDKSTIEFYYDTISSRS